MQFFQASIPITVDEVSFVVSF